MAYNNSLKQLIQQHNLTEEKVAELVGCGVSVIGDFVRKNKAPDMPVLKRIAAVLDVPLKSIAVPPPPPYFAYLRRFQAFIQWRSERKILSEMCC